MLILASAFQCDADSKVKKNATTRSPKATLDFRF